MASPPTLAIILLSLRPSIQDKVIVTHIHNLRPFNYDEERTDPVTIAQQSVQEFVIEEVLAHRGRLWVLNPSVLLRLLGALQDFDECINSRRSSLKNTSVYGVSGCGVFPCGSVTAAHDKFNLTSPRSTTLCILRINFCVST